MSGSVKNASGNVVTTRQAYDANNQLTAQYWQLGSTNYSETYTYSKTTGLLATHKPAVGNTLSFAYDALQRLSTVTGGIYGKTYIYRDISGTDKTTTQVASLTYDLPTDITYGYTYDVLGNIATYTEAGTTYTYTYDAQNQLTKQTGGGKTYTYSYDAAGNILSASNGTTSHSYAYENTTWRDLLTKFDGQSITYDNAGNPTSYYNSARWTMTWAEGRRLATASKSGTSLSFTYDSDGLRLSKNVNGTVHNYSYAGNKLMRETWGSNTLDFFYDSAGTPYALKYNGTLYYYITNLQGDVLKIVNTSGTPVVSYSYDPYGKPTVASDTSNVSLGTINPLRYRGYVYDTETGLYYVSSRYYDPEIGRWINADDTACLGADGTPLSYNLFAYCMNNPVNRFDVDGNWSLPNWAKVAIGAVATVAAVAVTVATGGAAAPVLLGVAASTITSGAIGYATGGVEGMKDGLANGFMMGGLSAFGGSLISAGVKAVKTARQGITIGRGMDKVNRAAGLTDTATYSSDALWKPLNGSYYNGIKKIFGEKAANAVSCACNKLYIKTMRTLGTVIYDSGLNGYAQAGQFYGMELEVLEGYANLVQMY